MTLDEARKIADIVAGIEGGDYEAVDSACRKLTLAFPKFQWEAVDDELTDTTMAIVTYAGNAAQQATAIIEAGQ